MTSFHSVVVAGLAAFVFSSTASYAKPSRSGRQCEPAVANPSMYQNCHLRIVQGHQICRCAIDQTKYDSTGSIPSQDNWFSALFRGGSDSSGNTGSSSVSSGSGNPIGVGTSSVS